MIFVTLKIKDIAIMDKFFQEKNNIDAPRIFDKSESTTKTQALTNKIQGALSIPLRLSRSA